MALSPKSPQFVGVGCERICGGRRRRSGPEASPEANRRGRSDCAPWTADVVGKTAVGVATSRRAKAWTGLVGGGSAVGPGKRHGLWRARCRILRRDTVLFLSDLEAQKLRFQGADHFAALRGPSLLVGKVGGQFRSASKPRADNPHPRSDRTSRNPHLSAGAGPRARKWPVLVFPGLSLGLGGISRYVGGRKNSRAKRSSGNPRGHRSGDRRSGGRRRSRSRP
jgi:hypothetical protein